ncbi:MAG TPA: exonuclease domain-containing protein [Rhodanobacteraceae bacterium]|nr:exonuclease domain-containing protein [Rhodanobacteraceae bacterium]
MRLFAPTLAFVDLETTGTLAGADAITEVGIVRVDTHPDGSADPAVTEWSTLVNPGIPIPPEIQALTGSTNEMVRDAPSFGRIADEVAARTAGALFVAHNARFDYGFLKHAFARIERRFSARVLCTVRLSRRLFPDEPRHNLDSVIARHGLPLDGRHRALGDARVLWAFVRALYRDLAPETIEQAARRVLRTPSLPPQLAPDAIDALPEAPGVYLFYGLNALPLYIGKSANLRERVGAHFSSDYRSATDLRLSAEIQRIEFEETAGEIGALLREATLVKSMLPAHNHALRRKAESGVLELPAAPGPPRYLPAATVEARDIAGRFGPFSSKRQAREMLRKLAAAHALCWKGLGLEKRIGPCFARQVKRCAGACVGAESAEAHHERLAMALAPLAVPRWPYPGLAAIREKSSFGDRIDVHVLREWCWLGTAHDEGELARLIEAPPRPMFDADIARLLVRTLTRGRHDVRAIRNAPEHSLA